MAPRRLYLDNAATSFPKPPGVVEAMTHYMTKLGASPGRGAYDESRKSAAILADCRERLCRLIGADAPDHMIFTLNASDSLNLAIKGVVRHRRLTEPNRPIHLITTAMDHNSILRPFNALAADGGVEWTCLKCDKRTGRCDLDELRGAIRDDTALVAMGHASNITGSIQLIGEIGAICRGAGVLLLVDAAQSLGHLPVDVDTMKIDMLAFPGHKGLLGPLGTGGLYIRPGVERVVATTRQGGTGSVSDLDTHPDTMPDRYEAGSHNTPGIAGLSEAVRWLLEHGVERIYEHELAMTRVVLERLGDGSAYPGLTLLGPLEAEHRMCVFAFTHEAMSSHEFAAVLESEYGILTRAGLHCAPRAHATFGTTEVGAVRISFGVFNTPDEAEYVCDALSSVCVAARGADLGHTRSARG